MVEKKDTHAEKVDFFDAAIFQNIVEQARDIILVFDVNAKVLYANQAALDAYGYSGEEFRSICVHDLRSPETRCKRYGQFETDYKKGIIYRTVHIRRNGEAFPVEASSRRVFLERDELIVSIVRDITGTVAVETVLKKSEEKYRLLHEELMAIHEELTASEEELQQQFDELMATKEKIHRQNMILISLHETALSLMNKLDLGDVFGKILSDATGLMGTPHGYAVVLDEKEGVFIGKAVAGNFALHPPRTVKVTEGLLGRAYQSGRIEVINNYGTWEHRVRFPAYEEFDCLAVIPLKEADRVVGALALAFSEPGRTLTDYEVSLLQRFADLASIALNNAALVASLKKEIRERKQAEEALRMSGEIFSKAFHVSPDLITISRVKDGSFINVNQGLTRITGYTREDAIGKTSLELGLWVEPQARELLVEDLERHGEVLNMENLFRRKDGSIVHGLLSARMIVINDEEHILAVIRDITEHKRAEEKLRTAHQQLMDIIDFLPDATFVIDQDKRVIAWNRAIEEMTEVRKEDIIGKGDYACGAALYGSPKPILIDFVGEDDIGIKKYCPKAKKKGKTIYTMGFVPSVFGGKGAFLWGTASPLFDGQGNQVGAIESIRDITEKRAFEDELRASRERYRALYEAVGGGVVVHGRDLKVVEINSIAIEISGLNREELNDLITSDTNWNLVHEDGTPIRHSEFCANVVLNTGVAQRDVVMGILNKHTGKRTWLQVNSVPLFDRDGRVEGVMSTFMDFTARKEAEAEIAGRKNFLEQILGTAGVMILLLCPDGSILSLNRFGEQITGYCENEVKGKNWFDTFIPEREREDVASCFKKTLDGRHTGCNENIILTKDGREVLVRWYNTLLRDTSGCVSAILAVGHDVTELRTVEAQLRQAQKMEAVGQLAGGVAHDFNNLLTGILGNISLALDDAPPGSSQASALEDAERAAKRASEITAQLLGFSRKAMLRTRPVKINDCIAETLAILRHTIDPRVAVETRLKPDLWVVKADRAQITQVLMNLCLNAQDAMPDGAIITLETGNVTLDEDYVRTHPAHGRAGDFVIFSVSDTGCGMSPEVRERVFEPFFTTKALGRGTGLGLAMVYGIVRQHDGWIECYSEVGTGTRFAVYLPRLADSDTEKVTPDIYSEKALYGGETVLVVDDEEMVRGLAHKILARYGYNVLTAEDGLAAIDIYRREKGKIDLVLLDLTMPRLSGRDTMDALKKADPTVKVLLSSGYSLDGLGDGLPATGADGFVQKPYRVVELVRAVRQALDMKDR